MPYGTVNADVIQTSTSGGILGAGDASSMKNRIINGAMVIDQRNAGASVSVSTSGVYVLDRWKNRAFGGGVFSVQQSSTAPAGFTNSTLYTVTTADSSIAAGDNYWIIQEIEGYNVADLNWGTANAKTITISFWVRSSVTGTFNVALCNGTAYDRSYVTTYTINSANTYEYKTVTIAGDTTGTWGTTNGGGITLIFNLGSGTDYQATANTWVAGFKQATAGSTNWIATNGATLYITGVQLEVGSSATGFEYRQYTTELQLCQRYFQNGITSQSESIIGGIRTGGQVQFSYPFKVTMRSTPSVTLNSFTAQDLSNGSNYTVTGLSMQNGQTATNNINLVGTWSSGGTAGAASNIFGPSNATGFTFSAEL